jgi:hypothetical protein
VELKLLEPMRAQFTIGSDKMALGGFMAVDRARLKALPGDVMAQLAATDELELIYLHLQSMRNFAAVKDRLIVTRPADAEEPAADGSQAQAVAADAAAAAAA